MKKFVLKAAVLAIGALAGVSAFAAVDLTNPTPLKYANEATVSGTTLLSAVAGGAVAAQTATHPFGASLGTDVTAYVRVDITGGAFNGNPTIAVNDSGGGAALVSVAQTGAGYVIFAVSPAAGENLVSTEVLTITTDTDIATAASGVNVTSKAGVKLQYRLYETLTAAANPGSSFSLKDSGAVSYIAFANALTTTVSSLTKTADVASSPSYSAFTSATTALAKVTVAVDNTVALLTGAQATAAGLLTDDSDVSFAGTFAFLKGAAETYATAGVKARLYLNDDADCSAGAKTVAAATTVTASSAVFEDVAAADLVQDNWLCMTAEGTNEITTGTYTADVDFDPQASYTVTDVSGQAAGEIKRNGVRMVAPITNQPAGWYSRLIITNSGTTNRDYTVTAVSEDGKTVSLTGAAAQGTVNAGKMVTIDLDQLVSVALSPAPANQGVRYSLVITVNAPQSEIDGAYQSSNGTTGSITNYVLSYKN